MRRSSSHSYFSLRSCFNSASSDKVNGRSSPSGGSFLGVFDLAIQLYNVASEIPRSAAICTRGFEDERTSSQARARNSASNNDGLDILESSFRRLRDQGCVSIGTTGTTQQFFVYTYSTGSKLGTIRNVSTHPFRCVHRTKLTLTTNTASPLNNHKPRLRN
jgi:hypothetical protein